VSFNFPARLLVVRLTLGQVLSLYSLGHWDCSPHMLLTKDSALRPVSI
jgi:hypothetical protein